MSEPDTRHHRHHFFADYEVYSFGLDVSWGSLVKTCEVGVGQTLELEQVLSEIKKEAAARHSVEPWEIRVRLMHRL